MIETKTETTYRLTFDRISRGDRGLVRDFAASDADDLAEKVWRFVKPRMASREIEVVADLETMKGTIYAGIQVGGTFTIEVPK